MTRLALTRRLERLEDSAGSLPLYIRRWLGEILTEEERAQADVEWQRIQDVPSTNRILLSPEARAWLDERGQAA
jgi:hypothetical protein